MEVRGAARISADESGEAWPIRGIARQYMAGTGTDWAVVKQPRHFVAMRSVHLCGYVRRGNASHGPARGLTGQSLNNPDYFMPMHGTA